MPLWTRGKYRLPVRLNFIVNDRWRCRVLLRLCVIKNNRLDNRLVGLDL